MAKPRIRVLCEQIGPIPRIPRRGAHVTISPSLDLLLNDQLLKCLSFDISMEEGSADNQLVFDIYAEKGHTLNPRFRKLRMPESLCAENLSLMKDWIKSCATSHSMCRSARIPPLPSRVIDVNSNPPKLLHSASINSIAPYAALSYTWGIPRKKQYLTTIANEAAHMVGMPFSELPRTFQEAIIVTQALELLSLDRCNLHHSGFSYRCGQGDVQYAFRLCK